MTHLEKKLYNLDGPNDGPFKMLARDQEAHYIGAARSSPALCNTLHSATTCILGIVLICSLKLEPHQEVIILPKLPPNNHQEATRDSQTAAILEPPVLTSNAPTERCKEEPSGSPPLNMKVPYRCH